MIRVFTFILFLGFISNSFSQETYMPVNINALQKKLSKSDNAIDHPKRSLRPQTWISRGDLMHEVYNVDIDRVFDGIDIFSLKLFYKDPKNTITTEIDGEPTTIYEYERIKYYFQDERLRWWEKTETLVDDPLNEAYNSFVKAIKLDERGRFTEKIKSSLSTTKILYKQSGLNEYFAGNRQKGLEHVMMVEKINELELFGGEIDTIMVQYSGIIAREIGDFKTAAKQYEKLIDIGLGSPNTYLLLKEDYLTMEDTASATKIMEDAFEVYPDSINIITNLIDLYIRTDEIKKGLQKIDESIKLNPEKGEFYYWKGRLMLNTAEEEGNVDEVLDVYKNAIKYNPSLYYVYYDVGFIYFMQGQNLFTQAGAEKDAQRRISINEFATEKFQEAIPMLTSALEYNESNIAIKIETVDTLRRIYYRLQMNDKYEEMNTLLKELRN